MPTGVTIALDSWLTDDTVNIQRREHAYKNSGTEQIEIGDSNTVIMSRTPTSLRKLAAVLNDAADHMEAADLAILEDGEIVPNKEEAIMTDTVVPSAFHEG